MSRPKCGACGGEMTPQNSKLRPELFLHDACLPAEFVPERQIREMKASSLTIAGLILESHATAVEKGWWEKDRPFSEGIALMHSELSEALEEWRKYGMERVLYFVNSHGIEVGTRCGPDPDDVVKSGPLCKPEGIAAELADVLIRIGDWCGKHNIPLEEALRAKMVYNKTRPHRHGGKLA